jgi:hypothetical protein
MALQIVPMIAIRWHNWTKSQHIVDPIQNRSNEKCASGTPS